MSHFGALYFASSSALPDRGSVFREDVQLGDDFWAMGSLVGDFSELTGKVGTALP